MTPDGGYSAPHNIETLERQFGLLPEGADETRPATHPFQRLPGGRVQRPVVFRADIWQRVLLPVAPDELDRVQFRRIARQVLHPQPLPLRGDELLGGPALVRRQPIPDDQQSAGDVSQQSTQEVHHLRALDRSLVQPEVEVVERDPGDGGKLVPIEVVLQHRRLAATRPCPHPVWPLAHPAFVDEDDRTPFCLGFFLMAGQRTRRQRRISSSFRLRAWPTGRWQLQPKASSTFQTWPG